MNSENNVNAALPAQSEQPWTGYGVDELRYRRALALVRLESQKALLVERFFSVPGMGPLLTDAINRYDTNVVQGCVFIYASLGILGVFLGDVLMMLVDPRITLTGNEAAR